MVSISEILSTVITSLPPVNIGGSDFTIQYFEGIIEDVKEQINAFKKANAMPYPAIWLIRDFDEPEKSGRIAVTGLTLIILIDTKGDYQTPERLSERIDPILLPIKDSLLRGLNLAGVLTMNKKVKKLTYLGNSNAGVNTVNSTNNSKLFADNLDGLKVVFDMNYPINLKLNCYDFR